LENKKNRDNMTLKGVTWVMMMMLKWCYYYYCQCMYVCRKGVKYQFLKESHDFLTYILWVRSEFPQYHIRNTIVIIVKTSFNIINWKKKITGVSFIVHNIYICVYVIFCVMMLMMLLLFVELSWKRFKQQYSLN